MAGVIRPDLRSKIESAGIYRLLGMEVLEAGEGTAVVTLRCDERHVNVDGIVHGGVVCLAADTAMGFAVRSQVDPGWVNRTLSLSAEWYAPARLGDVIRIEAHVEHRAGRYHWVSALVAALPATPMAHTRCLCTVGEPV
jgi:uncharacterized protein (TIGR00369 family)